MLDAESIKKLAGEWGRYKDVDGDGIPYRTIPGTGMPSYFTRGSGHNERGQYSERPDDYQRNVDRLARKHETAKKYVPEPIVEDAEAEIGIIAYGTSHWAVVESRAQLEAEAGIKTAYMRDPRVSVLRPRSTRSSRATRASTSSSRTATRSCGCCCATTCRRRRPTTCAACCTTTGCRSTRARSPTTSSCRKGRRRRPLRPPVPRQAAVAGQLLGITMDTTPTTPPDTGKKKNRIGLEMQPYRGGKTTLCAGCGHNAITERIIDAFFEMGIHPRDVIKLSGIGCSSKSPAYFLGDSHGFNSVHGRMPSVGTGALLANRKMIAIGISGDGDTGAIGIGQFVHMMRRNVPIVYIIEDNGCYGLTKGQFSPTADVGSTLKNGVINDLPPIDTCMLAIQLGATLRRALVFRRQEAAALDPQGLARPTAARR